MSLDMLAYMKNHLEAHPFDVPTPSCDPQSGPLTIFHSDPILAKMNISGFDMISCNFRMSPRGNFRSRPRFVDFLTIFDWIRVQAQKASFGPTSEASFGHLETPHGKSEF